MSGFDRFADLRRIANMTAVGPLVVDAMTIRDLLASQPATTPSQGLDAATVERCAQAMCVADGLDPDEHIIGGQATGFEDFGPLWQAEERSEGQLGLTNYKRLATAALATEPHQHGAGNGEKHGG